MKKITNVIWKRERNSKPSLEARGDVKEEPEWSYTYIKNGRGAEIFSSEKEESEGENERVKFVIALLP